MRLRWLMGIAVLAVMAGNGRMDHVDAAETIPAGVSPEVAKAIRELGDDRMAVREEASKRLLGIGSPAIGALEAAAKSEDPEVSIRAEVLLRDIKAGITPETPQEIAAILRAYHEAFVTERPALVEELSGKGDEALMPLVRLSESETESSVLKVIQEKLFYKSHEVLRMLLGRGDEMGAERFMEAGRRAGEMDVVRDWAAYTVILGRYERERKRLEAKIIKPTPGGGIGWSGGGDFGAREIQTALAYLHRAHGDLGLALEAARASGDDTLTYEILVELGDWKALTALVGEPKLEGGSQDKALAEWLGDLNLNILWPYQAKAVRALGAYYAGDKAKYELWLEETRLEAKKSGDTDGRYAETLAFLNQPEESAAACARTGYLAYAVDSLASRGLYFESLELVERAKREGYKSMPEVLVKQARVLYGLGEAEEARAILDEVSAGLVKELAAAKSAPAPTTQGAEPAGWHLNEPIGTVAAAHAVTGDRDKGLALAAKFLEQFPVDYPPKRYCRLFYTLFGEYSAESEAYFVLLHESRPDMPVADVLRAVGKIRAGEMKRDELEAFAKSIYSCICSRGEALTRGKSIVGGAAADEARAMGQSIRWLAGWLRKDLAAAGVNDSFMKELAKDGETTPSMDQRRNELREAGIAAAKSKDWLKMAKSFGDLAEILKKDWPTYLQGYALVRGGFTQEGEFLERRADFLMLAMSDERYSMAEAAADAGLWDVAMESYERILVFGEPLDVYMINAADSLASSGKVSVERAARLHGALIIAHVGSRAGFISPRADISFAVAKQQHDLEARAAAGRKDWQRVVEEVKAGIALYPGDCDGPAEWAGILDAAGRKAEVDAIVEGEVKYFEGVLGKYPRAANLHNSLAWLCAKTGRHLDDGLRHAETATEYFPKSAEYLDTLAEVRFKRAEFKEAVEVEKRAVELEPKRQIFRDSLQRFEMAADGRR